jgi:hypothetical protein
MTPPPDSAAAWVGCLSRADASSIEALRLNPSLEGALLGDALWLRVNAADPALEKALLRVPWRQRYHLLPGGKLRPFRSRLPAGFLPKADWMPLARLFLPSAPRPSLPARLQRKVALHLRRSSKEQAANVMLLSASVWLAYVETAPQIRLSVLRFAQAADQTLLWGDPLPPLAGERFHETDGIAAPCGFRWHPRIQTGLVRELLQMEKDGLTLLLRDGTLMRIPPSHFQPALRANVRQSMHPQEF